MRWDWQRPNWLQFQFEKSLLREPETQCLKAAVLGKSNADEAVR